MKTHFHTSLMILALTFVGCQKLNKAGGGVAVVDLDKIAQSMGWLDEMNKSLTASDADLQKQLEGVAQQGIAAIEAAKKQVATDAKLTDDQIKLLNSIQNLADLEKLPLTPLQRDTLIKTLNQANLGLQQARASYQPALEQRRRQLILGYRERVEPQVRKIAEAKGDTVVLIAGEQILYHNDQTTDITDEVLDELRKAEPAPSASAPFTTTPTK